MYRDSLYWYVPAPDSGRVRVSHPGDPLLQLGRVIGRLRVGLGPAVAVKRHRTRRGAVLDVRQITHKRGTMDNVNQTQKSTITSKITDMFFWYNIP